MRAGGRASTTPAKPKVQTSLFNFFTKKGDASPLPITPQPSSQPAATTPSLAAAPQSAPQSAPPSLKRKASRIVLSDDDDDDDQENGGGHKHPRRDAVTPTGPKTPASRARTPASATSTAKATPARTPSKPAQDVYWWLDEDKRLDAAKRPPTDPDYDPSTLYIPPASLAKLSDFERQYWTIKAQYFDSILFFKKGKFYELYAGDADVAQREFDLKVSDNGRGAMRMAGVPEAGFDDWACKFLARGFKVARVDQAETAAARDRRGSSAGCMKRELTQVLTQGTLLNPSDDLAVWCCAVLDRGDKVCVVLVDVAAGQVRLAQFEDDAHRARLETLLVQTRPKELVVPRDRARVSAATLRVAKSMLAHGGTISHATFPEDCHDDLGLQLECPLARACLGGMHAYLQNLRVDGVLVTAAAQGQIHEWSPERSGRLVLDGASLANLGIVPDPLAGSSNASDVTLVGMVSACAATPMGKRHVRSWLCHPLVNPLEIRARQAAVVAMQSILDEVPSLSRDLSKRVGDVERLAARIAAAARAPRGHKVADLVHTLRAFQSAAELVDQLRSLVDTYPAIQPFIDAFPAQPLTENLEYFETAFNHEAALDVGSIIPAEGVDPDFDAAEAAVAEVRAKLDAVLQRARREVHPSANFKDTGKDLHQIEVPINTKVPATWRKTSGTKSVARYHPPEILALNAKLADVKDTRDTRAQSATQNVFLQFVERGGNVWRIAAHAIADLDAVLALARAAREHAWECVPEFADDSETAWINANELRHAAFASQPNFVPNDVMLGTQHTPRSVVLTGPNMGGKSTLMRSVGLLVVLAQAGSLVPCASCTLSPFDSVQTRIGARDDLVQGHSTFMIELAETARILRHATPRSLLLIDELGRGTATFDGHAIAFATLHHLATRARSCMLFATHYAGLTRDVHASMCMHMACHVDDQHRQVTFLYKLVPGAAHSSHGMHVARMAGVPEHVVARAEQVAQREFGGERDRHYHTGVARIAFMATALAERPIDMNLMRAVCETAPV